MASAAVQRVIDRQVFDLQLTLLEPGVTLEQLVSCAAYFLPSHYHDVVTERAEAEGFCGWPLCGKSRRQQSRYRANPREGRIYETGDSSKFCSDKCMAASVAYAASLPKSSPYTRSFPLDQATQWLQREEEAARNREEAKLAVLDGDKAASKPPRHIRPKRRDVQRPPRAPETNSAPAEPQDGANAGGSTLSGAVSSLAGSIEKMTVSYASETADELVDVVAQRLDALSTSCTAEAAAEPLQSASMGIGEKRGASAALQPPSPPSALLSNSSGAPPATASGSESRQRRKYVSFAPEKAPRQNVRKTREQARKAKQKEALRAVVKDSVLERTAPPAPLPMGGGSSGGAPFNGSDLQADDDLLAVEDIHISAVSGQAAAAAGWEGAAAAAEAARKGAAFGMETGAAWLEAPAPKAVTGDLVRDSSVAIGSNESDSSSDIEADADDPANSDQDEHYSTSLGSSSRSRRRKSEANMQEFEMNEGDKDVGGWLDLNAIHDRAAREAFAEGLGSFIRVWNALTEWVTPQTKALAAQFRAQQQQQRRERREQEQQQQQGGAVFEAASSDREPHDNSVFGAARARDAPREAYAHASGNGEGSGAMDLGILPSAAAVTMRQRSEVVSGRINAHLAGATEALAADANLETNLLSAENVISHPIAANKEILESECAAASLTQATQVLAAVVASFDMGSAVPKLTENEWRIVPMVLLRTCGAGWIPPSVAAPMEVGLNGTGYIASLGISSAEFRLLCGVLLE